MRMKMVTESQTLKDAAKEFLAYKKAQKIRDRTLKDYHKYISPFKEKAVTVPAAMAKCSNIEPEEAVML